MERGLRGDQSPPLGFPADPGALSKAAAEELYAQGAIDKRRSLGPDLFATFQGRYDRLNAMLNGIGPEDWGKPCYHTRRTRSVESFLPTIIAELAVHAWDIRSTLEPAPSLSVDSVPILMEKIPGNSRPWAIPSPGNHTLSGVLRYRFELKGPGADSKDIVIEGDTARMEDSIGGPASLCLAGNTEHFVLLMYGRLRLASSISTGHFKAEGDTELVSDFDRWLGGH